MNIQKVTDHSFGRYGKVLEGYDLAGILKEMEHTPLPKEEFSKHFLTGKQFEK